MTSITRIDFITIPTLDVKRTAAFYQDVLGLEESPHTVDTPRFEFDLGGTTLALWNPTEVGRKFQPNTNEIALHCDDVEAMRTELESRGVAFSGPTIDTCVCNMALFADPEGNPLMLHGRYVPHS
ncbi:MAG TPA: VOC family protein [Solirubrobacterales bacterium]|nr:VOC family protein [Solirubrobacterales bacterium]